MTDEAVGGDATPDRLVFKLAAIAIGCAVSLLLFLGVDYGLSVRLHESALNRPGDNCGAPHPIRHHAFRPMCTGVNKWGRDRYAVYTNSLGLRDYTVREVPQRSGRKRVLFLGDSFTDGSVEWSKGWVGRFMTAFPQVEVLNGAIGSYSPSNYLKVVEYLIAQGIVFDDVIVCMDISDIQDEAAYYTDDGKGGLKGKETLRSEVHDSRWNVFRESLRRHLVLTDMLVSLGEDVLVREGHYRLPVPTYDDVFDMRRAAWTYASGLDSAPFPTGFAPLGVEGGIRRAQMKMDTLHELLHARGIPLSVAVYPWAAQLVHDSSNSIGVTVWKRWCAARGCKRFIDAFPAFFAVKRSCPALVPGCWYDRLFTFGDVHYNEAGYALTADQLIAAYKKQR